MHKDLIEVDSGTGTFTQSGDSGGIYCTVSGHYTLGVHVGGSGSKGSACKHANISYEFSVYRY